MYENNVTHVITRYSDLDNYIYSVYISLILAIEDDVEISVLYLSSLVWDRWHRKINGDINFLGILSGGVWVCITFVNP